MGIDVLDDFLPPACAKVQVDVWHHPGFGAQEALKEQIVEQRIHVRDAEQVGHD